MEPPEGSQQPGRDVIGSRRPGGPRRRKQQGGRGRAQRFEVRQKATQDHDRKVGEGVAGRRHFKNEPGEACAPLGALVQAHLHVETTSCGDGDVTALQTKHFRRAASNEESSHQGGLQHAPTKVRFAERELQNAPHDGRWQWPPREWQGTDGADVQERESDPGGMDEPADGETGKADVEMPGADRGDVILQTSRGDTTTVEEGAQVADDCSGCRRERGAAPGGTVGGKPAPVAVVAGGGRVGKRVGQYQGRLVGAVQPGKSVHGRGVGVGAPLQRGHGRPPAR